MSYIIKGETGDWEVVIGLEVHCEVISKAKLFSGAATAFGAEANTQVSFVDAGFPGMLPVINHECVEQAVRTGFGLNATINKNRFSHVKTITMPICRTGIRFLSPITRLFPTAILTLIWKTAKRAASGLNGCIWNRTRAS